ncbi:MAG: ribose-phosphate pyrophosphokinase [Nitrososphaeraceae archaeon]|nr:ribose-phosphate pyrophosphokinase [Nitrososphaeraceae archaeon]
MLKNSLIITGPSSEELGTNLSRKSGMQLMKPEIKVFSDGESKIRMESVKNKNCIIIQSLYPPIDRHIIQLLMMIHKCKIDRAAKITVIIPYMAYARQDKEFVEGEVITIALLAKLIKYFNIFKLITIDIHSKSSLSYFGGNIKNISAIPQLARYVLDNIDTDNMIVVSPDYGGYSRAQKFAKILKKDVIFLNKNRNRQTGDIQIETKYGLDLKGKKIIIVDDMISTGNSIIKSCELLKKNRADNIFVVCTHALLLNDALIKIKQSGANEVISTNSIPNVCSKVDLSDILYSSIKR